MQNHTSVSTAMSFSSYELQAQSVNEGCVQTFMSNCGMIPRGEVI